MKDERSTERLRRALATADRGGVGRGYPAELRGAAVEHARRRRAAGASMALVAEELGLHAMTLTRWSRARSAFRAVRVAQVVPEGLESTATALVVYGPCGLRIEGSAVAIAALVRSLG